MVQSGFFREKVLGNAPAYKTILVYDSSNRLYQTQMPEGLVQINHYDTVGNKIMTRDPAGVEMHYNYTPRNLVSAERRKHQDDEDSMLQQLAKYGYDAKGQAIEIRDADNNLTSQAFDSLGRLREITRPNDSRESFSYDAFGNRLTHEDGRGNKSYYEYNALELPTRETDPANGINSYKIFIDRSAMTCAQLLPGLSSGCRQVP